MKISIITPIYNTPKQYLESYFEVLNNQIHISDSDVEVIIINDGGDTPDFNFVENSRFNVVYLTMPENRGPGASRQTGIDYVLAQSKSDYILFIDSDDRLLSSNSLSVYQFYFTSYCNNHHCIPDILQPSEQIWEKFTDDTNSEIIQDKIEQTFPDCLHGLMVSTQFLKYTQIRMVNTYYHEDIIFSCELAVQNPQVCMVKESTILHRSRLGSISFFNEEMLYELSKIVSTVHILNKIRNHYIDETGSRYNVLQSLVVNRLIHAYEFDGPEPCRQMSEFVINCLWAALNGITQEYCLNRDDFTCYNTEMDVLQQKFEEIQTLVIQYTEADATLSIRNYLLLSIKQCLDYAQKDHYISQLPTCAIIVPVYNPEINAFLSCLQSINNQYGHQRLEAIIVNDGSTKWVGDDIIYQTMDRVQTTIITLPLNKGVGYARQTGLSHAKTDYVMHIDADDLLVTTDVVYHLLRYLYNNPSVDGATSYERVEIFDPQTDQQTGTNDICEPFETTNSLHGLMCKLSSLKDNNITFKNIQYGEDGLFVNDLHNHRLAIHTLPFIGYLHRHGNLTHRVYTPFSNINTLNDLYNHIYYNGQKHSRYLEQLLYAAEISLQGAPKAASDCPHQGILIPDYFPKDEFRWILSHYYGWLYITNISRDVLEQLFYNINDNPESLMHRCPFLTSLALRYLANNCITQINYYNPYRNDMFSFDDLERYTQQWVSREYLKNKDKHHIPSQMVRNFPWEYTTYRNVEEAH